MAVPPYDFDPIFVESEGSITARLVDPFSVHETAEDRFNVRQGTFLRDWAAVVALEFLRVYEAINAAAYVNFLTGASGDALDQKGIELNLERKGASPATTAVTVEGAPGTVIPAGSRFSTTTLGGDDEVAVEFVNPDEQTIPAEGVISFAALAVVPGDVGNVDTQTITQMLDLVDGVTYVTNEIPATGGNDDESNDEYRARLLDVLRAAAGPGTKADYRVWAQEIDGVDDAAVFPHWAGGGTVKVVVLGEEGATPASETVREVQDHLDPSVALLSLMELDEGWTGGVFTTASKAEGLTSLQLSAVATQTVVGQLERPEHLDFIGAGDKFTIWVDVILGLSSLQALRFKVIDTGGLIAEIEYGTGDLGIGAQVVEWSLADMTVDPNFDWAEIAALRIELIANASGPVEMRFDTWRVRDSDGGVGQGRAPIGAQITVSAARRLPVAITAQVVPMPGYTLATIKPALELNLQSFFEQRRSSFTEGYLYATDVANVVHDTPGVLTYANVTLNGLDNLSLEAVDVPYLESFEIV